MRYIRRFHHFQQKLLHLPNDPKWRNLEHFSNKKRMIYHCAFVRFSPSGSASTSLSKSFGFTHDFFDIIAGSIYHPVGIYILHTYKHNKRTLKIDYRYKKVKNESITRIFLSSKSLSDFPIASFLRTPSLKIHQENFRKVHIRICIRKKSFF